MQLTIRRNTLAMAGVLVAVVMLGALALAAIDNRPSGAVAQETDTTRTITVNGEGRVSLPPDTVMMTLGIDARNAELGAAQTEAAETMDAIIAAVKGEGVAEKDIQTGGYSISIERDWNQPSQPVIGYLVSQTINVKVREIDNAGKVIQAAVDAGANNVGGVWFALENPEQAIAQARELAVADARAKAEELARLTDSTLGPVQSIVEGYTPSTPIPYAEGAGYAAADAAKSASPTINPGTTEVSLTVTISWAIQ